MAEKEILRAYRYAIDPTDAQLAALAQHAGAQRWAYNYALARKIAAHEQWRALVAEAVAAGTAEDVARKTVKVKTPSAFDNLAAWRAERGDATSGVEGVSPWWNSVSSYSFSSGCRNADTAWKNWLDSLAGRRKGRRVGYPRFKKKGRARDTCTLHHDWKKSPTIRPDGYRRVRLPVIGSLRIHGTTKPLTRLIAAGKAVVKSATISRAGTRWYVSLLADVMLEIPDRPTRRQREAGAVGVDLGVKTLAALSTGEMVPNPRHADRARRALTRAQRALSRTQRGSAGRRKAARRVGAIHARLAATRTGALHQVTARLAKQWAVVAIEDLNVAGMTSSARGTTTNPGKRVRQKAGLNRAILDASFGETRRQLVYKTGWYGSTVAVCDRWAPTSKTCSACGAAKTTLSLSERVYHCDVCGLTLDRDTNAARNIARWAVASETGETLNAGGDTVRPPTPRRGRRESVKPEDPGRPGSPQASDGLPIPTPRGADSDTRAGR